jgi:hypothetical protein
MNRKQRRDLERKIQSADLPRRTSRIASVSLAPHTTYRRNELQAMYESSKRRSRN